MSNESEGAEPPALTALRTCLQDWLNDYADSVEGGEANELVIASRAALSAAPIGVPADLPPGTCVGAAGTRCLMKDR